MVLVMEAPTGAAKSILAGYLTRQELQRALGKAKRTVQRMESLGMPSVKVGNTSLYHPQQVETWLIERAKTVRPGRPRRDRSSD